MTSTVPRLAAALAVLGAALPGTASAGELRGSMASMRRQHGVALAQEYRFVGTRADVRAQVEAGALVPLDGNADYVVADWVLPFARPEVKLFVERLAAQYRAATGQALVVTSATRPRSEQPSNSHALSVHPAGMAVDLRVPAPAAHRAWLEQALLGLENRGVLDVTREYRPPHYHVAVFPAAYLAHVARSEAAAEAPSTAAPPAAPAAAASDTTLDRADDLPARRAGMGPLLGALLVAGAGAAAGRQRRTSRTRRED